MEFGKPLILDCGSAMTKCAFGGTDAPRSVFPSVVGRPKSPGIMVGMDARDHFVGEEAFAKRGILRLKYPIEFGQITNFFAVENLWHHCIEEELGMVPEEHAVMMTETPANPKYLRERTTAIIFERFQVQAFRMGIPGVLSLYASGRENGIVLDLGDSCSVAVPVYEGHCVAHAADQINMGGRDITSYFVKLLGLSGYEMTTSFEREIVRLMKEGFGFVSPDMEDELLQYEAVGHCDHDYVLPDDSKMTISTERFRAPEILFDPSLNECEFVGIHHLLANTIQKADREIQETLCQNVVLAGGTSLFNGMCERVSQECAKLLPSFSGCLKVSAPEDRQLSAVLGGALLASLSSFSSSWITRKEYDEQGAGVIHRKCF